MPDTKRSRWHVCLSLTVPVLGLLVAGPYVYRAAHPSRADGPATLAEVVRIADEVGLHHASDRKDGVLLHTVVLAEAPVSAGQACLLRVGDPHHPCWIGRVTVARGWKSRIDNHVPGHSAVWGEMFVFGDPAVIDKLVSRE
jgi:hypothetical protein